MTVTPPPSSTRNQLIQSVPSWTTPSVICLAMRGTVPAVEILITGDLIDVRRRRVAADDRTEVIPQEEWVAGEGAPPPVPPPGAGPEPPPGPPPGWLAVENPWPWLLLVLVAVAALLVWLFAIRGSSDRATVPRVVGLSQPVAIKKLQDAGFNVTAVRKPAKSPAGRVFAQ